jgi:hypothetical protein
MALATTAPLHSHTSCLVTSFRPDAEISGPRFVDCESVSALLPCAYVSVVSGAVFSRRRSNRRRIKTRISACPPVYTACPKTFDFVRISCSLVLVLATVSFTIGSVYSSNRGLTDGDRFGNVAVALKPNNGSAGAARQGDRRTLRRGCRSLGTGHCHGLHRTRAYILLNLYRGLWGDLCGLRCYLAKAAEPLKRDPPRESLSGAITSEDNSSRVAFRIRAGMERYGTRFLSQNLL